MNDVPIILPQPVMQAFALRTLRPETPIFGWLAQLDEALAVDATHFGDRQLVLDLADARLHGPGTRALLQELQARDFRVVGLTGIEPAALGPEAPRLPPILSPAPASGLRPAPASGDPIPSAAPPPIPHPARQVVVARNVRSGQVVANPDGDVTIIGSVSSGAEIVAAGSIHVYGVLQGRAIAGTGGAIFCRKLEAELLRIGDVFLAADDMPELLRGRACRAWRDGDAIQFAALT